MDLLKTLWVTLVHYKQCSNSAENKAWHYENTCLWSEKLKCLIEIFKNYIGEQNQTGVPAHECETLIEGTSKITHLKWTDDYTYTYSFHKVFFFNKMSFFMINDSFHDNI